MKKFGYYLTLPGQIEETQDHVNLLWLDTQGRLPQQEMAREAQTQSQSALHGFNSSISSAWNTLSQFGSNRGSSDSMTQGADSTMSAQDSMMASKMRSAVESYAKGHNISVSVQ